MQFTLAPTTRRRLGVACALVFALALFMGAGPGIGLINPDPLDPDARRTFAGAPIVYVWAVAWFLVEVIVIVIASIFLWNPGPEREAADEESPPSGKGRAA